MKETIKIFDQLVKEGVISGFAIGGAVAAIYYLEPTDTQDLDIFIPLAVQEGGLVSLSPVYSRLKELGGREEEEYIWVAGVKVQIIPLGGALVQKAFQNSVAINYEGRAVKIFSREYLMAICLQTGRPKDRARIAQFLEQTDFDRKKLLAIVQKHHLKERWAAWSSG